MTQSQPVYNDLPKGRLLELPREKCLGISACVKLSDLMKPKSRDIGCHAEQLRHAELDSASSGAGNEDSLPLGIEVGSFDQAIISWNSRTPPGSYLILFLQARVNDIWTPWYRMGLWNTDGQPQPRTSFDGQTDEFGSVHTDTLILNKPGDAIRARVELGSVDGKTHPKLRFFTVNAIDSTAPIPPDEPYQKAWGVELDVPEISQLSVDGGKGWCSAASTAMALGYWSKQLNRPELDVGLAEAAHAIHDAAWDGTGNWTFNTAYAGEFEGIRAYVTRFDSVSSVERWVAAGVPLVVSVKYAKMNPQNTESTGHLMVVRGFTKDGDPIFNDPWTNFDKDETVRRVFPRKTFADVWLGPGGSYGTVYVIHPKL